MRIGMTIAGALAIALAGSSAQAAFLVTAEAPGAVNTTASFDYKGVETFNSRNEGTGQTFTSNFTSAQVGTPNIQATYTGVTIRDSDQYGGAGNSGEYAVAGLATQPSSYSITFTQEGTNGVNYFGYWLSALDIGNKITFYDGATEVFSFTPDNVLALVAGNPAYLGKPGTNPAQNTGEPYVFLNFFDQGGTFDKIVFEQTSAKPGAGYESDNHTVGYFTTTGGGTPIPGVPEPATWMMLIAGFGMVGGAMRQRRRDFVLAA